MEEEKINFSNFNFHQFCSSFFFIVITLTDRYRRIKNDGMKDAGRNRHAQLCFWLMSNLTMGESSLLSRFFLENVFEWVKSWLNKKMRKIHLWKKKLKIFIFWKINFLAFILRMFVIFKLFEKKTLPYYLSSLNSPPSKLFSNFQQNHIKMHSPPPSHFSRNLMWRWLIVRIFLLFTLKLVYDWKLRHVFY